jgi:hypothetical protein
MSQKFFKTAGGTQFDTGLSVAANCQNVFIASRTDSLSGNDFKGNTATFNGGAVISGLSHCGKQKFFKTAGKHVPYTGYVYASSVVADCDKCFVAGSIPGPTTLDFSNNVVPVNGYGNNYSMFVSGLDNCGNQKFFKTAGNRNYFYSVVTTKLITDNHCLFASSSLIGSSAKDFNGTTVPLPSPLGGSTNIVVAGLDKCGHQKFFQTASVSNKNIDISSNKNRVFVTGRVANGDLDFNHTPITITNNNEGFVAGLNKCGNQKFFKTGATIGQSVTSNCGNGAFVSGFISSVNPINFQGQSVTINGRIFVAKFDEDGNQKFFVTAGDIITTDTSIITDNENGVFLTGLVRGPNVKDFNGHSVNNLQGGNDIFVAGLTRCGKQIFFKTAGSQNNDSGTDIVVNDQGIFVTGSINGTSGVDFNGCPITLPGIANIFVAKLDYCGHQQFFLTAGTTAGTDSSNQLVVQDNEVFVTGGIGNTIAVDFRHHLIPNLQGNNDIFVARIDDLCGKYRSKRTTMTNFPR